jgi:hypothetical protein
VELVLGSSSSSSSYISSFCVVVLRVVDVDDLGLLDVVPSVEVELLGLLVVLDVLLVVEVSSLSSSNSSSYSGSLVVEAVDLWVDLWVDLLVPLVLLAVVEPPSSSSELEPPHHCFSSLTTESMRWTLPSSLILAMFC